MADSYWRKIAAPIISRVIAEHGTDNMRGLRRALREAYPFGPRRFHPYRIWCDEIRRQLAPPETRHLHRTSKPAPPVECPGQLPLLIEP